MKSSQGRPKTQKSDGKSTNSMRERHWWRHVWRLTWVNEDLRTQKLQLQLQTGSGGECLEILYRRWVTPCPNPPAHPVPFGYADTGSVVSVIFAHFFIFLQNLQVFFKPKCSLYCRAEFWRGQKGFIYIQTVFV